MKVRFIIGADLSKKHIDFVIHQLKAHLKISNDFAGFVKLFKWLEQHQINSSEAVIVMEHTGLYSYQLEQFLHDHDIRFSKHSALAIKRSMGLVRGKNDQLDARRIAQYGFEKRDRLPFEERLNKHQQRLQLLQSTRERFVRQRAALITALKEYQDCLDLKKTDPLIVTQTKVVKSLDEQIKKMDQQIQLCIQSDQELNANYELLQSITGVGRVLAVATLIKTSNFTRFKNARKFACFCGTAPFEHSSGSSIRGKTRISHLCDKKMKTLLEMGARSAIQYDKELCAYYKKRTASGKTKRNAINVVRNKIIYRMFAVVKRQTPFLKTANAAYINPTLKN